MLCFKEVRQMAVPLLDMRQLGLPYLVEFTSEFSTGCEDICN